jgi:hypothetical protein
MTQRRSFLLSGGGVLASSWIAAQWPAIAAAHDHAEQAASIPTPAKYGFFTASEAADVDAISAHIVPSGDTPGAREAHTVFFIDAAMASFFAGMAPAFRTGLAEFQSTFRSAFPAEASYAAASTERQHEFLLTVDSTPFFERIRMLTLIGMFTSPKYTGNYQQAGWKLIGFEDRHIFTPPFGYYDRDYPGFVPYPGFEPFTVEKQS